jgi:hypothetical protein
VLFGVFLKKPWSRRGVLMVKSGEMRGKDGDLAVTFQGAKNTPRISDLFFCEWYWESPGTSETPMSGFKPTVVKGHSVWVRRQEDRRGATKRQADRNRTLQRRSLSSSNKLNQMIHPSSVDGDVLQRLARP